MDGRWGEAGKKTIPTKDYVHGTGEIILKRTIFAFIGKNVRKIENVRKSNIVLFHFCYGEKIQPSYRCGKTQKRITR